MLNHTMDRGTLADRISASETRNEVASMLADPIVLKKLNDAVFNAAGNTGSNEDIVSDACIAILTNAESFDWTRGNFLSWAMRIAGNLARNWRKASANNGHESQAPSTGTDGTEKEPGLLVDTLMGEDGRNVVVRRQEMARVNDALDSLRDDEQIFIRAMLDGKTQTEAGAILGWSAATSTRRMKDIVGKVRAYLATE